MLPANTIQSKTEIKMTPTLFALLFIYLFFIPDPILKKHILGYNKYYFFFELGT